MSVATLHHQSSPRAMRPESMVSSRLAAARRQLRSQLLVAGLAIVAGAASGLVFISVALDLWFRFDASTRIALAALGGLTLVVTAWTRLIRPMMMRLTDRNLAALLDRHHAGLAQHVATVQDLPRLVTPRVQASPGMVRAAVADSAAAVERLDLAATVRQGSSGRFMTFLILSLLVPAVAVALRPDMAELWAARWLAGSARRWPQRTYLSVMGLGADGVIRVPRGEPTILEVNAQPSFERHGPWWRLSQRPVPLDVRSVDTPASRAPQQVSIRFSMGPQPMQTGNFAGFGNSAFRFEMPPVSETTWITIRGGDDWLEPFRLEPIDRPRATKLVLVAKHSHQERGAPRHLPLDRGQVVLLAGSELQFALETSEPMAEASLVAKSGPAVALARQGDRRFAATWRFTAPQTMELRLKSRATGLDARPTFIALTLEPDRPPRITLRSQGVGRRITPQARVPLEVQINDDFGLVGAFLESEATRPAETAPEVHEERQTLELSPAPPESDVPRELREQLEFSVKSHALTPGTLLRLRAVAQDNAIDAPQQGESRWLAFQIVSPEELFYDLLIRQRQLREKFRLALVAAQSQSSKLAEPLSPDAVGMLLRTDRVVARDVWQVTTRLEASLTEMTLNDLGSPTARELLSSTVIVPLHRLHSEELPALHTALSALTAGADNEARSAAVERQGQVVESMKKILAQMAQWESFVDVVNQLREVIKLQEQVRDSAETLRRKKTEELFEE